MTQPDIEQDKTVDARGSACPGPLMDLIGSIRGADPGTVVLLLSDNDQSTADVPEWADEAGNELLAVIDDEDHYGFYVEKV